MWTLLLLNWNLCFSHGAGLVWIIRSRMAESQLTQLLTAVHYGVSALAFCSRMERNTTQSVWNSSFKRLSRTGQMSRPWDLMTNGISEVTSFSANTRLILAFDSQLAPHHAPLNPGDPRSSSELQPPVWVLRTTSLPFVRYLTQEQRCQNPLGSNDPQHLRGHNPRYLSGVQLCQS